LSVHQRGDVDGLFLDDTGFRSLRTREVTLNAYIDDVGSSIDAIVQTALITTDGQPVCGIVEPTTKNYWCYLSGDIYVLSRHPAGKITAWSIYKAVGDDGVAFTPEKFVVFNGQVYCRSVEGNLYKYGGDDNNTYDATVVTVA